MVFLVSLLDVNHFGVRNFRFVGGSTEISFTSELQIYAEKDVQRAKRSVRFVSYRARCTRFENHSFGKLEFVRLCTDFAFQQTAVQGDVLRGVIDQFDELRLSTIVIDNIDSIE